MNADDQEESEGKGAGACWNGVCPRASRPFTEHDRTPARSGVREASAFRLEEHCAPATVSQMEEKLLAKICEPVLIHRALGRFSPPSIVASPGPHWRLPCMRRVSRDRPWSRSALPAA